MHLEKALVIFGCILLLTITANAIASGECPNGICRYSCSSHETEQGLCCRNRKCCVVGGCTENPDCTCKDSCDEGTETADGFCTCDTTKRCCKPCTEVDEECICKESCIEGSETDAGTCECDGTKRCCKPCIAPSCPPGWINNGDRCYLFTTTARTWLLAKSSCEGGGAFLAEPDTQTEISFLTSKAQSMGFTYWIGANDRAQEGTWTWGSSCKPLTLFNWHTTTIIEPNNAGGVEHCVNINSNLYYEWNDDVCENTYRFICEKGWCEGN